MVVVCKSAVDEYKEKYKLEKMKNELFKTLTESQNKKIEKLEQENKAYKILLKEKLSKE